MESNHHKQIQSLPHYHYANPQLKLFFSSRFWRTSFYSCRINSNRSTTFCFSTMCFPIVWCSIWHIFIKIGAGSENRTHLASLEDWRFTTKLYPQNWRKEKDLNLRGLLHPGALAKLCIRPLCHLSVGGRRGIRTPGGFDTPSVFKTDALDRSATLP